MQYIQYVIEHKAAILGAALAISEALALIPGVKSSGIFDFFYRGIRSLLGNPVVDKIQ